MARSRESGGDPANGRADRRKRQLVLEWALWIALAAVGYGLTFEFDEPLDIYRFGASGWPRFLLLCIVAGASLQAIFGLLRIRREAVPAAAEHAGAAAGERLRLSPMLFGIFTLPLVYLLLMPRVGFFVVTPVFVMAFLWVLQVRRLRLLIGVTAIAYGLVLLIFVRLFYVALPVGNWPVFYDVNNWIVVAVRNLFAGV